MFGKQETNMDKPMTITLRPDQSKLIRDLSKASGKSISSIIRTCVDDDEQKLRTALKRAKAQKDIFK
jgi:hypothetical protein